jgi:HEAT repeat protein
MTGSGKEFVGPGAAGSGAGGQRCRQFGVGLLVVFASCGVLASFWHVAADENHRQVIAAVQVLERARDSAERIDAIRDLVRPAAIEAAIVIPPLIRALADPVVLVRVEAASALGPATSTALANAAGKDHALAAVAALNALLDDPDPSVRIAAVYSLASIAASKNPAGVIHPQRLVEALLLTLADPDPRVRASTIAALGVAGPMAAPEPPPALLATLHDESCFNRAASVRALARFSHGLDEASILALLGLLETEPNDSPAREACIEVLNQADPRLLTDKARSTLRTGLRPHDRNGRVETVSMRKTTAPGAQPAFADAGKAVK